MRTTLLFLSSISRICFNEKLRLGGAKRLRSLGLDCQVRPDHGKGFLLNGMFASS